jgi:hypothetical protein
MLVAYKEGVRVLKVGQNLPARYVERAETPTVDKARHVEKSVQKVQPQDSENTQKLDNYEIASNKFERLYGYTDSRNYNQAVYKAQMKYSEQSFEAKGKRCMAELSGEPQETTVGDLKIRNTRSFFV